MTEREEKFTPGPWISVKGNSSGREVIAPNSPKTRARVARMGGADRDGNAHLIAAAPDMYEALTAAAYALLECAEGTLKNQYKIKEHILSINAVLVKARGETK